MYVRSVEAMQSYCPNCGAPFTNGTVKCEYCGAALPVLQPVAVQQTTYQQPNYQQPNYQPPIYQQPVFTQPPAYQQNVYYRPFNAHLPIRSKYAAAALAFFLGGLGAHKFYLGKSAQGILMLIFCWTYIPSFIAFIDFIVLLCSSDQAFMQKYNCRIK